MHGWQNTSLSNVKSTLRAKSVPNQSAAGRPQGAKFSAIFVK
jgi:hypothetical protein